MGKSFNKYQLLIWIRLNLNHIFIIKHGYIENKPELKGLFPSSYVNVYV